MTRRTRIVLYCSALVVVFVLLALIGGGSRNRGSLQSYQAELRARGEKLTFEELDRSRSTNLTDTLTVLSNAVPKLLNAGFSPGDIETTKYVGPGRARLAWKGASPNWRSGTSSNAQPTWALVAQDIAAAQSALAEIRAGLHEPTPSSGPATNLMKGFGPSFNMIRSAAQWLMAAALNEAHQGHVEEALQDLEALASLAQMDREECTLVAQAIRVAVAGLGLATSWEVLQAPGWTEPQLARLQKAWEPVYPVEAIEFAFVGERAFAGEIWSMVRKSGWRSTATYVGSSMPPKGTAAGIAADYAWFPLYRMTSINADELFRMRLSEEILTGLRMVEAHQPWKEAKQHIDQPGVRIKQVDTFPARFRYFGTLVSFPNVQRITTNAVHTETERQLTLAAIALKRCQLRHGTLPPSLEALVPELLPATSYDPMSGKALCYRLKPDGSFVLYSVGEDGKDDGGDPRPASGNINGLWEGRDVVWPMGAAADK